MSDVDDTTPVSGHITSSRSESQIEGPDLPEPATGVPDEGSRQELTVEAIEDALDDAEDEDEEYGDSEQQALFLQLAERLGYDIDDGDDSYDDDDEEEYDDEDGWGDPRDPRVDALLAEREQEREEQEAEEYEAALDALEQRVEDGLRAYAKRDGITLDDHSLEILFATVLAQPATEDGPDVASAWERYRAMIDRTPGGVGVDFSDDEQRVAATARRVQAALDDSGRGASSPGSPDSEGVDFSDPEQRVMYMARRMTQR